MSHLQSTKLPPQPSDISESGLKLLSTFSVCDWLNTYMATPEEYITKPNAISTQMIYSVLLEVIMLKHQDNVYASKEVLLGMMQYKELYADALQFAIFYTHVRQMVLLSGIHQFSQADLIRPDPARLRNILTSLINFAKFRDLQNPVVAPIIEAGIQERDEAERLEKRIDALKVEINEVERQHLLDAPRAEEVKSANAALEHELRQLKTDQKALASSLAGLQKEKQELSDKINKAMAEASDLQSANIRTKARIVQSPERVKGWIKEKQQLQAGFKVEIAQASRAAREIQTRLEMMQRLEKDLIGLIDLQNSIDAECKNVDAVHTAINNLQNELHTKSTSLATLEAAIAQSSKQMELAEEKRQKIVAASQDIQSRDNERKAELKSQYEAKRRDRAVYQKELDERRSEKKAMTEEMAVFRQEHEADIDDLLGDYWGMRDQMTSYMQSLQQQLGLEMPGEIRV